MTDAEVGAPKSRFHSLMLQGMEILRHPQNRVWVLFMSPDGEELRLGKTKHGDDKKEVYKFSDIYAVRARAPRRACHWRRALTSPSPPLRSPLCPRRPIPPPRAWTADPAARAQPAAFLHQRA